jgi:hypothetical protein
VNNLTYICQQTKKKIITAEIIGEVLIEVLEYIGTDGGDLRIKKVVGVWTKRHD